MQCKIVKWTEMVNKTMNWKSECYHRPKDSDHGYDLNQEIGGVQNI